MSSGTTVYLPSIHSSRTSTVHVAAVGKSTLPLIGTTDRARFRIGTFVLAFAINGAWSSSAPAQALVQWQVAREAVIGGTDNGTEQYLFTKIMALMPTDRGTLVVADVRQQAVRVFGPAGAFSHDIGRQGAGPGEFEALQAIGLIGDTVWTTDVRLRRTTLFRLDGKVLQTLPWEPATATGASTGEGRNILSGVFADGTAWGEHDGYAVGVLRGGPELPKAILRMSRIGRSLDTIAVVPTSHTMYSVVVGTGMTFGQQRFPDGSLTIGSPSQSVLYLVDRAVATSGRNASFRVTAVRSTGDTVWTRNLPYTPRRLEKAVADSFVNSSLRNLQRSGASPDVIRRVLFVPDYRSPVSSGFAAHDGTLWLRREEGRATVEYWVIAPNGTLTAAVTVPQAVTLWAARGTQLWGVEKDADDVQSVVRFRIAR